MGGKSLDHMREDFNKDVQRRAEALSGFDKEGILRGESHVETDTGVKVWVVYCTDCRRYLGVNYPSDRCGDCINEKENG